MIKASDIAFGVEVEGLMLDKTGKISRLSLEENESKPYPDPEIDLLFSSVTPEVEVKNLGKHKDHVMALKEITTLIETVKEAAAYKDRTLTYDSRVQADRPLNTIGTHIHLDLLSFQVLMQQDSEALSLIVGEFMRYWFKAIIDRYCYSRRIKSRVAYVLKKTDFTYADWDNNMLKSTFIPYKPQTDHVKLIKHRPEKESLEICLPDSFDFSTEADVFIDIVTDARNALRACLCSYERREINPMDDSELQDVLSNIL